MGKQEEPAYAELQCRSNFTFLQAASHPEELVQQAAALGYRALAVTDLHTLAGTVRAHVAAQAAGIKLLVGAEVQPSDGPSLLLWAADRPSYGRLTQLLTLGKRRAAKGECRLTLADVAAHADGLLAGVPLRPLLQEGRPRPAAVAQIRQIDEIFRDRVYALAALHQEADDRQLLHQMAGLAAAAGVPWAAAGDVRYHRPERRYLHDVLLATYHHRTVADLAEHRLPSGDRHLQPLAELARRFADFPAALARTVEIADRCQFSLAQLRYEYPKELAPPGVTPFQHLEELTWLGAQQRYPKGIPAKIRTLVDYELQLIRELGYEAYFLTVWDLVRFARERDILCQGRGSAANSVVCYCLGITCVDPAQIDVLFERFISRERNEAPDIDVDFEHERREEVLQYIYQKYGRHRAGMTAVVTTYQPRSAVRDVGKALGLSLDRVDQIAKAIGHHGNMTTFQEALQDAGLDPQSRLARQYAHLVEELIGFPRHLSQHVGGMVLTDGPLSALVPIENAAMPGRTVIEWNKDDLDDLGILKVDCLSLGMLTALRKAFALIQQHDSRELTLATVPVEDPAVYRMMQRADTVGVFQIESRAQMSMLPRLKPACFYDLVIEVSIVRPGPIQGQMVHPYLRRRAGLEKVSYPDERIRAVLHKTLGVPIFQEQVMKLAVVAAGFTPGEADQLRRAMAAWKRKGGLDRFHQKFLAGMLANGYSAEFAERVFLQIRGFGEYGFPESHAASFAALAYVSAWLKCYYPAAFAAAIINSQPMGFYAPAQLVADFRRHGGVVRPIDVNASHWDCTLEPANGSPASAGSRAGSPDPRAGEVGAEAAQPWALRLGFRLIDGLSRGVAEQVVAVRGARPFASVEELALRTGLSAADLQRLARADAFGSLTQRRTAVWQALPPIPHQPLADTAPDREPAAPLPSLSPFEEIRHDYATVGLSLKGHPFQFIRHSLVQMKILTTAALAEQPIGREVQVAGLVLIRQRPGSAKGTVFMTLEDETGTANLILYPTIWERYHRVARRSNTLLAAGRVQRESGVTHLLVDRLADITDHLADLRTESRDFR